MLLALFGSAAMLIVLSLAEQRNSFLLALMAFAFVSDMYRPASSAMIADLVSAEARQYSFGLMYIAINLGFAIAPPLGGVLAEFSFKLLFWGDALTTALFGLIILVFLDETLPDRPEAARQDATPMWTSVKHIAGDATFLLFCVASLLNAIVFMQGMSTLPIAMIAAGFTKSEFGRVIAINGVLIVCAQLPLTTWLSRYDRMFVIAVGGALISLGFGLTAFGSSLAFVAFTIVIWTVGEMFQAPFKNAVVTDLAPTDLRGRYLGLFTMCYSSALTLGAPAGGFILESYGASILWKCCFCVGAVAVCVYVAIRPRINARSGKM